MSEAEQLRDRLREPQKRTEDTVLKKRLDEPKSYDRAAENTGISKSPPSSRSMTDSSCEEAPKKEFAVPEHPTNMETVRQRDNEDDRHDGQDGDLSPDTIEREKRLKGAASNGSSGDGDRKRSPNADTGLRTRQYCTQACLLGLKRGWDLDGNCPNVSLHQTAEGGNRHAITIDEFVTLVDKQFRRGVYRNCVALDPFGFNGKIRSIGAFFKLELAPYGYTFVAKGTTPAHYSLLKHESLVYSRLERLQGEAVPVHLGIADLSWGDGYVLPGAVYRVYMMMMSWGGEVARDETVPDLDAEKNRLMQAMWDEGVSHPYESNPRYLWNEEARCVMAINFDQSTFRPAPKHRRLLALSRPAQKRKRRGVPDSEPEPETGVIRQWPAICTINPNQT